MNIFEECISYRNHHYDILFGRDEMLVSALAMGCEGAVGSTYNYNGKEINRLV